MASLNESNIRRLCGRPLFASFYWAQLINTASMASKEADLKQIANDALQEIIVGAVKDACVRIDAMWSRFSPVIGCSHVSRPGLLAYLFHAVVMCTDTTKGVVQYKSDLQAAILRGIINGRKNDDLVSLECEPITKEALLWVGKNRLKTNTDGVMELLVERITMPIGAEKCDYGEALEGCFAWALMRKCLLAKDGSMTLKSLLKDFLFYDASCNVTPEQLDEFSVQIDYGHRWSAEDNNVSPFELLDVHAHTMIHHPDDKMAGPDILHLAFRNGQSSNSKPVIYQLKNRATGTLMESAMSLNIACMHPDVHRGGGAREESPAHASMRKVLEKNSTWQQSLRVVVSSRPYSSTVLHHVTWLNRNQWYDSPLVLLVVNKENLGVDLAPHINNGSYGAPSDWKQLCQGKLRHSAAPTDVSDISVAVPKLLTAPNKKYEIWSVSLKVKVSWSSVMLNFFHTKQFKEAILSSLRALVGHGEFTAKWPKSESAVELTFANFEAAMKLVEKRSAFLSGRQCAFSFCK
eukprot:scaffold10177_cov154-Ochromonas_danica.AAC.1